MMARFKNHTRMGKIYSTYVGLGLASLLHLQQHFGESTPSVWHAMVAGPAPPPQTGHSAAMVLHS